MGGITGYDKDGNPRELGSAEEAHKLYDKGEISFTKGQNLKMRSSDGRIFNVFAENYELARKSGASLVTDTEVREQGKADEIRDGGKAAAFARGAASTVVDPLLAVGANLAVTKDFRDISRDALKNQATDLAESDKQFPGTTTAGRLAGYVAPALLTGGASLGTRAAAAGGTEAAAQVTARGLAAATLQRGTVAGISNAIGETAAQIAIKQATKLGAGKLATKVAGWGAQGAAEGAIQSAADAMAQATLDNPDHVAESMLMSGIEGGAIGAAGNVLLMGTGNVLWKGAKAGTSSIAGMAKRLTRNAAGELGGAAPAAVAAAEQKVGQYVGAAAGGAASDVAEGAAARVSGAVDPESPFVKFTAKVTGATESDVAGSFDPAAAAAIDNPVDFVEKGAEGLVSKLRKAFAGAEDIDEVTSTHGAQYDSLRNLAKDADQDAAFDFATGHVSRVKAAIGALAEGSDEWSKLAGMKKMASYVKDQLDKDMEKAVLSDNPAGELAVILDRLKTNIQWSVSKRPGRAASPELRRAWDELRKISDMQQGELASANSAFGDAAADWYAKKNAAWTKQLGWKAKFGKTFLDIPEQDGWDYVQDFAPDKAVSYMDKAGEFEASGKERALREAIEGRMERMDAIAEEAGFDAGVREKAKTIAAELRESLDFHDKFAAVNVNRIKADKVAAQANRRASGIKFTGEVIGSVFGPLGSVIGGRVAEAAARPDRIAAYLASARTAAGKRSGSILGAAGGVANRARGAAGAVSKAAKPASRALVGGALFLAYRDKVREITDATTRTAGVDPDELDAITPGLGQALEAKRAAALQYLKNSAPVGATGRGMFGHLEGPKPPEYQAREFMERVRAVEDPMSVLEDVKAGRFSAPAIEALRAVYPGTFAQVQQVVTEQLFDLKKPPPYESRVELFRLFGIAADPSLSPEFIGSMQSIPAGAQAQQNPQKPSAGPSSSRLASMSVSQTERTLTR